jgi:hypothetical protein
MSSRDAELWGALLSSILEFAKIRGFARLEVIKKVAKEITGTL